MPARLRAPRPAVAQQVVPIALVKRSSRAPAPNQQGLNTKHRERTLGSAPTTTERTLLRSRQLSAAHWARESQGAASAPWPPAEPPSLGQGPTGSVKACVKGDGVTQYLAKVATSIAATRWYLSPRRREEAWLERIRRLRRGGARRGPGAGCSALPVLRSGSAASPAWLRDKEEG